MLLRELFKLLPNEVAIDLLIDDNVIFTNIVERGFIWVQIEVDFTPYLDYEVILIEPCLYSYEYEMLNITVKDDSL